MLEALLRHTESLKFREGKIEENLFNFINFSFFISIFKIGYSRLDIFLFELRKDEFLTKKATIF